MFYVKRGILFSLFCIFLSACGPDLKVKSVSHTPSCAGVTDQITFTATVVNAGGEVAGQSVLSFKIGGETNPKLFTIPALNPGNTFTVQRQIVLGVAQNYRNTIVVDVNNNVQESNESNNQQTEDYTVGGQCCSIPPYSPTYWNDAGTVQNNNNCYNYGNNKRTDTFAQPGKAAGAMYSMPITCQGIRNAAMADGLMPLPSSGTCPSGKDKIALVVAPCVAPGCSAPYYAGNDYHWYRQDSNHMWSHKPGHTQATNVDNSNQTISNPENANRCSSSYCYSEFCGYFCSCSDSAQGQGHEHIQ